MTITSFSAHLDYLQRIGINPTEFQTGTSLTRAPSNLRRICRIQGIGRTKKPQRNGFEKNIQPLSEELPIGLYGNKIPFAFLILGEPGRISVNLGTWSSQGASPNELDDRQRTLETLLNSIYTSVKVAGFTEMKPNQPLLSGFALGIPTAKPPDSFDGALPIDRLIRAMAGANWACLVLAQPIPESVTKNLRLSIINEMRSVQSSAETMGEKNALANHYSGLLQIALASLTQAQASGTWRTAVYLLGDRTSYYRLSSVWLSIFSGDRSRPEPLRIWNSQDVVNLFLNWALPDDPGPSGPDGCFYKHLFQYQTILTSFQLAAYVHMPQIETSGFSTNTIPDFDVVPPAIVKGDQIIPIGNIIQRSQITETIYGINSRSMTGHVFIPGITGSGKTNTIFHLLKNLPVNVPFLVIEPAKTEYRALLKDEKLRNSLRVFTFGNENLAPFRLNPFEVVSWPQNPIGVHLDLLRSVFATSFGMWTPLPQVLETCLHRVYEDYGWDITTNSNYRLLRESDVASAFPTLTTLLDKVDEVTQELGYEKKVMDDMRAALRTRINGLRAGGKGRMLDVKSSLPMDVLLSGNTIIELEGIGDDDDKAFIIGLLLIRLAEYRRAKGESDKLEHLLIIEEAHRLLANVGMHGREEEANPRGKAVETFVNLLSEIRAYGQGIVIADQVPVKLAPDVIKNTNIKIAHRIVAQDDRIVLAGAMSMNDQQGQSLANLQKGEAAVYSDGDDAPVLVRVPAAKGNDTANNKELKDTWHRFLDQNNLGQIFLTYPTCNLYCQPPNSNCDNARKFAEDPEVEEAFAAFVLSLVTGAISKKEEYGLSKLTRALFPTLHSVIRSRIVGTRWENVDIHCVLTHSLYRYMEMRGQQCSWGYENISHLVDLLLPSLLYIADRKEFSDKVEQKLVDFINQYNILCQRAGPHYGCDQVCGKTCLYRYAIEHISDLGDKFREMWTENRKEGFHELSLMVASRVLLPLSDYETGKILLPVVNDTAKIMAWLCFCIHEANSFQDWQTRRNIVDTVIDESLERDDK